MITDCCNLSVYRGREAFFFFLLFPFLLFCCRLQKVLLLFFAIIEVLRCLFQFTTAVIKTNKQTNKHINKKNFCRLLQQQFIFSEQQLQLNGFITIFVVSFLLLFSFLLCCLFKCPFKNSPSFFFLYLLSYFLFLLVYSFILPYWKRQSIISMVLSMVPIDWYQQFHPCKSAF